MHSLRPLTIAALAIAVVASPIVALAATSGDATPALASAGGTYEPLTPTRLLDTRIGVGAPERAVGPGGTVDLQVAGVGGVPATGVSAVVLNVTETDATKGGYVTVYPDLTTRPTASNLNFPAELTLANSVTVMVGANGKVDLFNYAGDTQLVADVMGYFVGDSGGTPGGFYHLVTPQRVLDTRSQKTVPARDDVTTAVDYGSDVNPHIRALAVNITVVGPTKSGYLTAWDGTGTHPTASTVNFNAGATTPNFAIVPVSTCALSGCEGLPSITIYNGSNGSDNVVVDVVGFFDDGTLAGGMIFNPIAPTRIADTRIGLGASGAIGAGKTDTITPPAEIIGPNVGALAMNVTAVGPTKSTYVTLFPAGLSRPTISTLNPVRTVANAAIVTLGNGQAFSVYNNVGSVNFVADVAGSYTYAAGSTATATRR